MDLARMNRHARFFASVAQLENDDRSSFLALFHFIGWSFLRVIHRETRGAHSRKFQIRLFQRLIVACNVFDMPCDRFTNDQRLFPRFSRHKSTVRLISLWHRFSYKPFTSIPWWKSRAATDRLLFSFRCTMILICRLSSVHVDLLCPCLHVRKKRLVLTFFHENTLSRYNFGLARKTR